jgi:hypothetical protein
VPNSTPADPPSGLPAGSPAAGGEDGEASFVLTHLIDGLKAALPESERPKLAVYEEAAKRAGANETAEWHRAFTCAQWATQVVGLPAHSHLRRGADKAIEAVKQVAQTIGAEIGDAASASGLTDLVVSLNANRGALPDRVSVSPKMEAEITWVYEAVHVAEDVAHEIGWDAVPWPQLLDDVLNAAGRS